MSQHQYQNRSKRSWSSLFHSNKYNALNDSKEGLSNGGSGKATEKTPLTQSKSYGGIGQNSSSGFGTGINDNTNTSSSSSSQGPNRPGQYYDRQTKQWKTIPDPTTQYIGIDRQGNVVPRRHGYKWNSKTDQWDIPIANFEREGYYETPTGEWKKNYGQKGYKPSGPNGDWVEDPAQRPQPSRTGPVPAVSYEEGLLQQELDEVNRQIDAHPDNQKNNNKTSSSSSSLNSTIQTGYESIPDSSSKSNSSDNNDSLDMLRKDDRYKKAKAKMDSKKTETRNGIKMTPQAAADYDARLSKNYGNIQALNKLQGKDISDPNYRKSHGVDLSDDELKRLNPNGDLRKSNYSSTENVKNRTGKYHKSSYQKAAQSHTLNHNVGGEVGEEGSGIENSLGYKAVGVGIGLAGAGVGYELATANDDKDSIYNNPSYTSSDIEAIHLTNLQQEEIDKHEDEQIIHELAPLQNQHPTYTQDQIDQMALDELHDYDEQQNNPTTPILPPTTQQSAPGISGKPTGSGGGFTSSNQQFSAGYTNALNSALGDQLNGDKHRGIPGEEEKEEKEDNSSDKQIDYSAINNNNSTNNSSNNLLMPSQSVRSMNDLNPAETSRRNYIISRQLAIRRYSPYATLPLTVQNTMKGQIVHAGKGSKIFR